MTRGRLSRARPLSYQSWDHPQQPLGLWLKYAINLDNLCIISTLYTMLTGSAPGVWGEGVLWMFYQIWSTFLCCEFYNVVPGHCFSVWRAACEGFSDRCCSQLRVPIVSGANCSYKEIGPDHLTTKLVSYQIPVPHLRSDCLLIYIYSLMTWPARSSGWWTLDIWHLPPD